MSDKMTASPSHKPSMIWIEFTEARPTFTGTRKAPCPPGLSLNKLMVLFSFPNAGPAYIEHVVHPLQVDGSIHAQFGPRALGKFPGEFDIDRHRSVLYSRI